MIAKSGACHGYFKETASLLEDVWSALRMRHEQDRYLIPRLRNPPLHTTADARLGNGTPGKVDRWAPYHRSLRVLVCIYQSPKRIKSHQEADVLTFSSSPSVLLNRLQFLLVLNPCTEGWNQYYLWFGRGEGPPKAPDTFPIHTSQTWVNSIRTWKARVPFSAFNSELGSRS